MPEVKPHTCPFCGVLNERVTHVGEGEPPPDPGDVTICFSCGEVGVFTELGTVRKPTAGEQFIIGCDPHVFEAQQRIRMIRRIS